MNGWGLAKSGPTSNSLCELARDDGLTGNTSLEPWPNQSSNLMALTIAPNALQREYFPAVYGSPNQ
jgi:hypothetical protein